MTKQKTHKGLKKRFKITASGKVKHKKAGKGHLLSKKTAKHKRRLTTSKLLTPTMSRKIKSRLFS